MLKRVLCKKYYIIYFSSAHSELSSSRLSVFRPDHNLTLNLTTTDFQNDACNDNEINIDFFNTKNFIFKNDENELKKLFKEFVKVLLKIKFEKFSNTHPGLKIPERALFKECLKKEVPTSKYEEFIIAELNQPEKYLQYMKSSANINKRVSRFVTRPLMDIINEESF
jgi:hypothetical protein